MTLINESQPKARVSVLMTIYNAAPFLRESIDSLMAQTFKDWELIAIENGSTDESPAILAEYQDPRIRVISLPKNIGRIAALCDAFDQACGEFVAVLDADDAAYPERFAKQVEFLDSHPETVLVGSWAQHIDRESRVFNTWQPPADSPSLQESLGWINPIVHSSAMYRRKEAVMAGGYPRRYIYAHDYALLIALVEHQGQLSVIPEYLCKLRVFSGNMSSSFQHGIDVVQEGLELVRYAGEKLPLSKQGRRMNRRSIAKYEIRKGIVLIRSGHRIKGLSVILSAFGRHPEILWVNGFIRSRFHAA